MSDVEEFHKTRRMFCIMNNTLQIAQANTTDSHAQWFQKEGWIKDKNDPLMNKIVRGMVNAQGDVYFYIGDFEINKRAEEIFFTYLKELTKELNIQEDAQIFGGLIKGRIGEKWAPIKKFGKVKENRE